MYGFVKCETTEFQLVIFLITLDIWNFSGPVLVFSCHLLVPASHRRLSLYACGSVLILLAIMNSVWPMQVHQIIVWMRGCSVRFSSIQTCPCPSAMVCQLCLSAALVSEWSVSAPPPSSQVWWTCTTLPYSGPFSIISGLLRGIVYVLPILPFNKLRAYISPIANMVTRMGKTWNLL